MNSSKLAQSAPTSNERWIARLSHKLRMAEKNLVAAKAAHEKVKREWCGSVDLDVGAEESGGES